MGRGEDDARGDGPRGDGARGNPWTTLGGEVAFENAHFRVRDDRVIDAAGRTSRYATVAMRKQGVAVLPVDAAGRTVLVGQWRYALGAWRWELPKGGAEPGEDPLRCARRELEEEANLRARGWAAIARLDQSAAIVRSTVHGFLAWDVEPRAGTPDPQEVLELRALPFAEAVELVLAGEVSDSVSSVLLLKAEALRRRGALPPPVLDALG